jgi:hypothetical protein
LAANKSYDLHLVCAQNPGIGSTADLSACGLQLMVIDDTNQTKKTPALPWFE